MKAIQLKLYVWPELYCCIENLFNSIIEHILSCTYFIFLLRVRRDDLHHFDACTMNTYV